MDKKQSEERQKMEQASEIEEHPPPSVTQGLPNGPSASGDVETETTQAQLDFGDLPAAPDELHELEDTADDDDASSDDEDEDEAEEESQPVHANQIPYPSSHVQREPNPTLPDTVTTLTANNGSKVYLVGTAHFSESSQEDVSKTITATQPDIVLVELCSNRANILQLDEETLLKEAKNINFSKVQAAIKQSGMVQGIMHILLLSLSAHLTKELGMAPGGEFRRAFREAQKIPGCRIHLGDRPIQVTLRRTLCALSLWQKIRLAWYIITSKEPISKEEVEKCKQRDLLEEILREMAGEFPALSRVLVKERDQYLANSLRIAARPVPCTRADSGYIPATVVGVVGIGHVPGIIDNWEADVNIKELMTVPEGSTFGTVVRWSMRAAMLGLVSWGCYHATKASVNFFYRPPVEIGTCPAPKFPGLS